jgi:predicted TIM-barrel fold metal-dependent hydrolase
MIIDAHVHLWKRPMLPDSVLRSYLEPLLALDGLLDLSEDRLNDWPMSEALPEGLVEGMNDAGIDRSVILPLDFGMVEPARVGVEAYNDWVFETAQENPDRIIPFMGIDPTRPEALHLVEKYVRKFDARGIKIYPATGFFPNEARLDPFWKRMDELGLAVVTHAGASWGPLDEKYNHPVLFQEVLERFPHMKLVIAHLGGKFRTEMYDLVERYPNAYTDCSALQGWLPSNPEVALDRLKEVTQRIPGRALFGSDWPLFDLAYSHSSWVRFIQEGDWGTAEQKDQLMGGNFMRMMSR